MIDKSPRTTNIESKWGRPMDHIKNYRDITVTQICENDDVDGNDLNECDNELNLR